MNNLEIALKLAPQFSLEVEFERPQYHLVRFKRDDVRIDVWRSGTVGIYKDGKQRFLRDVKPDDIAEIFANPDY